MNKKVLILISFVLVLLVGFFVIKKVYVSIDFNSAISTGPNLASVNESVISNDRAISNYKFEGFGANSGGFAGDTILVTNLNDSGAGSLREALSKERSNAIIKFSIAGTINLKSDLVIKGHDLTIDGFSAPAPGITLTAPQNAIVIAGNAKIPDSTGSNVVIQGLRVRSPGGDAFQVAYNAHDVVIDHNSIYNAGDGGVDVTEGAYNVTVSWNIINKTGAGGSLLSYDASKVSYHHNIFYGNSDRNPLVVSRSDRYYSSGPTHQNPVVDVRYNLIWDYGIGTYLVSMDTAASGNVVSNLYKNNPQINPSNVVVRSRFNSGVARADAYIAGNVCIHDCRGSAYSYNGEDAAFAFRGPNSQNNQSAPFVAPAVSGPPAIDQRARLNEWQKVKSEAGASLYPDDSPDAAVRSGISIPAVSIFTQAWNGEEVADLNNDGIVNSLDYSIMSKKWNEASYYLMLVNWLKK